MSEETKKIMSEETKTKVGIRLEKDMIFRCDMG